MLQSFLSNLKKAASNDQAQKVQRKHPRREQDRCVISIHGQSLPVSNWSLGGILINGDERLFGLNQDIDFTIKFKLHNKIIEVEHSGKVVRKAPGKIALEFAPVSKLIRTYFQQVIDDSNAQEFARSQAPV